MENLASNVLLKDSNSDPANGVTSQEAAPLKPGEQLDKLLNGRLIIQDPKRFMFGIDAVLLSDFASQSVRYNDSVIDLGTGTAIIPLLMETAVSASATAASKKSTAHFTALEVQPESANMAARSVAANSLESKIKVVEGDIKNVQNLFPPHSFNVVTTNPPYMINQHGHQNSNDAKTIARHEILCNLQDIIAAADYLLLPHGKFFMIHRPFRLPEIFAAMNAHHIEPKRMRLVAPSHGKEPNIVLIEGRKNANPELKIQPTLYVYENPGVYTSEIQEIYEKQKIINN